jgi:hypothetical protein
VIAKSGLAFWEFLPPMGFTYHKAWGKIYHEPNLRNHDVWEWEGYYAYSSIVGGKLCLLIGVRTFSLLRSRHNIPPNFLGGKLMDIMCPPNTPNGLHVCKPMLAMSRFWASSCLGFWFLGLLYTRSQGWKNLGPTLSNFGLMFGPRLLINARTLTSQN